MKMFHMFNDMLYAYAPEIATRIERRFNAGIDITDELFETLCEYVGDDVAESWLDNSHIAMNGRR